jgi:integrase
VSGYKEAVARACRRAGVEHWSPARLRHSALTEVRRLYGLEAAQVAGGHAHAAVTELYAETSAELARKVASERG